MSDPDFERLARTVYLSARNGAMDDPAGARLTAIALAVSAERFDLGFADEPGWLAALEEAMAASPRSSASGVGPSAPRWSAVLPCWPWP